MKTAVLAAVIALLSCHGAAAACSIQNRQEVQVGDSKGVRGVCSNNGSSITCTFVQGEGITCDGPAGSYNGSDLNALVFSACGCSAQQEKEMQEKKEL
jgi:hypothetical protein